MVIAELGDKFLVRCEADQVRCAAVEVETCQTCHCRLSRQSSNERAIYEIERERVKKIGSTGNLVETSPVFRKRRELRF